MSSEKIRRIPAVLAVLVLAAGLVAHGLGSPAIIVTSAMTAASDIPLSSDVPMPGKCNGCAGDEEGMAADCMFRVLRRCDRIALGSCGPLRCSDGNTESDGRAGRYRPRQSSRSLSS